MGILNPCQYFRISTNIIKYIFQSSHQVQEMTFGVWLWFFFFLNPPSSFKKKKKKVKEELSFFTNRSCFDTAYQRFQTITWPQMVCFSFIFRRFAWSANKGTSEMFFFSWNVLIQIWLPACSAPQNATDIFHLHTTWSHRLENCANKMSGEKNARFHVPNQPIQVYFKETFWHISWHFNRYIITLFPLLRTL